jgi:calcineurin-like phosphoesterase family protein
MSERVYFTADQHYGHSNIIQFCKRPFSSVDEMNETLIENHNRIVKPGDLVYFLGDLFWRSLTQEQALSIAARLNGQKYYINGNHEERMSHKDMKKFFIWQKDLADIHPTGYPHITLCHYAMRVWNGSHRGAWSLYGHSHGELEHVESGLKSFDVGVDCWDYKPVSLEEVAQKMNSKVIINTVEYTCVKCKHSFTSDLLTKHICAKCGEVMEYKKL